MISVRRWGPYTYAEYADDGNPFGGYLRRVLSESDPADCIALQRIRRVARGEKGTRVRECEKSPAGSAAHARPADLTPMDAIGARSDSA